MDGQVGKGVVELLVVHPQQTADLGKRLLHPLQQGHSLGALFIREDAQLQEQHHLPAVAQAHHHATEQARMGTLVVERKAVGIGIVAYAIAQAVVDVIHEMAFLNGQNLVEGARCVEADGLRMFIHHPRGYLLAGEPPLVAASKLHLVPVGARFLRP